MKTIQEQIAIMQAFADGKTIEYRNALERWEPIKDPLWNWTNFDYRIKPEPKVIWVNEYPSGRCHVCHETKIDAVHAQHAGAVAVHYIESPEQD